MHARHARSAYRYDTSPGPSDSPITVAGVKYHQSDNNLTLSRIVRHTPKPTGHHRFSSIEVVHSGGPVVEKLDLQRLRIVGDFTAGALAAGRTL